MLACLRAHWARMHGQMLRKLEAAALSYSLHPVSADAKIALRPGCSPLWQKARRCNQADCLTLSGKHLAVDVPLLTIEASGPATAKFTA